MGYLRKKLLIQFYVTHCHLRIMHEGDAPLHSKSENYRKKIKKSDFLRNSYKSENRQYPEY